MRSAQAVAVGLSLVVGIGGLVGCGSGNSADPGPSGTAPSETTVGSGQEPASDDSPTDKAAADDAIAAKPGDTAAKPNRKPTSSADPTLINPPQAGVLTAQQSNAQINLRSRPTTESASKGYGLVGDSVELLRASEGSNGLTWYYVKFDESGAEGWIRGDFIDTSRTAAATSAGGNQAVAASIDSFTTDELFSAGSGGCGMTLMPAGSGDFIFFNGLENTSMWMKLDGTMTRFRRTDASGPEFYGQSASQSFTSYDNEAQVDVRVQVGSEEGYESVNIESGTLRLKTLDGTTEIAVEGDAGC